jgi:hypothetical protein
MALMQRGGALTAMFNHDAPVGGCAGPPFQAAPRLTFRAKPSLGSSAWLATSPKTAFSTAACQASSNSILAIDLYVGRHKEVLGPYLQAIETPGWLTRVRWVFAAAYPRSEPPRCPGSIGTRLDWIRAMFPQRAA